ncbi:MAG: hypothetical protein DMG21_01295 [Acidobacteria bacterium]|nr:MAG: hypothetical protein DMG21_01295 [Acidobacteriota bacterium]
MVPSHPTQTVPLTASEDGTLRMRGSRVTLDSLIHEFKQGATAEEIQADFPSLGLGQVYSVIACYLEHRDAVEDYLRREAQAADETRRWIAERMDFTSFDNESASGARVWRGEAQIGDLSCWRRILLARWPSDVPVLWARALSALRTSASIAIS